MTSDKTNFKQELLKDYELNWFQKLASKVLSQGLIPRHLALIMDGNRRYAKQRQQKVIEGHIKGFSKLSEVLFWCRQLGISELTVYAFSIENFRRTREEVEGLMQMAENKFRELLQDKETLCQYDICIRIVGNISYLPVSLQQLCAELMLITKHHKTWFINFALSYTARDEMCTAIEDLLAAADQGVVKAKNFNEALLSTAMYSKDSPDPDLLIRTSGEVRLSDFLLWQTGFTVIEFIPKLWPELTFWQFLGAILHFQWQAGKIYNSCRSTYTKYQTRGPNDDFEKFVTDRRQRKLIDASLGNVEQKQMEDIQ